MAFIKADKNNQICAIDKHPNEEAVKQTLNHFRGRPLKLELKNCLKYLKLATLAIEGSKEAQREINSIHYTWNHHYEEA